MIKNEISAKQLNADAQNWIEKLRQALLIQDNGKCTVKNYAAEMILLFKYYSNKTVAAITQADIEQYTCVHQNSSQSGSCKMPQCSQCLRLFLQAGNKNAILINQCIVPAKAVYITQYNESATGKATVCSAINIKRILCNWIALWQWF